jgi:Arc/MetJ family transcription regulator
MAIPVKKATAKEPAERRPTREGKVRKELWLDPEILGRAQSILGTATERETVEVALDMIAFRRELLDGTRALAGIRIDPIR